MGERNTAIGVQARTGEPEPYVLRFRDDAPQPLPADASGHVLYRLVLELGDTVRARVDIPLQAGLLAEHDTDKIRTAVGTLAARQLSRLAVRDRLPTTTPLLPLRLVGLDPHVVRLLAQPRLPLHDDDSWVVLVN